MNGGQVAVSVCKGWVDLNSPAVALHGTIDVLHLLQSVPHVAVCISKVGVDSGGGGGRIITLPSSLTQVGSLPDGFLVVDQCLS